MIIPHYPQRKAAIPRSVVLANQQSGTRESWSCLSIVGWTGQNLMFPPSLSFVTPWKYLEVEDLQDLAFQGSVKTLWKVAMGFPFTLWALQLPRLEAQHVLSCSGVIQSQELNFVSMSLVLRIGSKWPSKNAAWCTMKSNHGART